MTDRDDDHTAGNGLEWIDQFLDHLFDDMALLVELREYLFLQGSPERWPVSVLRGLQPAFDELQARRDRIVTDARWVDSRALREAGLDGASLDLKLAHVEHARQLVREDLEDGLEPLDPGIRGAQRPSQPDSPEDQASTRLPRKIPKWIRRFLRHMASLLAAADTILESLGARIAHALKELKQLLEKLCTGTADELDLRAS
jgi:hypothetical protein